MWRKNIVVATLIISILCLSSCISQAPSSASSGTPNKAVQLSSPQNQPERLKQSKHIKLRLSLEESIKMALEHNRQILMAQQGKIKAKGQLNEAHSALYPWLSGNATYTRLDEVIKYGAMTIGELNNYKAELSLRQSLYSSGRIRAGIRLAQLGAQFSEVDFRSAEEFVIFQTHKTYYDILLAQEFYEVNKKSLEVAQKHLTDVTKKHKQGMVSNYDLLRAKVQVANVNAFFIKSSNALHLARTFFIYILGIPLEKEVALELTDKLAYKPTKKKRLKDLCKIAFQTRSDLRKSNLQVKMQEQNVALARAEARPDIRLFGNWGNEKPAHKGFGENAWDSYWNAGVMLSLPLFEGWRVKGKIIQAKAGLNQSQLAKQDLEAKIRLEIKQALLSLQDAEELVESQKENVKQAEEGLRLARIGYQQGVNTQLEVMDAQMSLDTARKHLAEALYFHLLAKTMLEKATGRLIIAD